MTRAGSAPPVASTSGRSGGRPTAAERDALRSEITRRVALQQSNAEIARDLGLCESTVANWVKRFGLLGMRSHDHHRGLNAHASRLLDEACERYWVRRRAVVRTAPAIEATLPAEDGGEEAC